jgi:hypothetical protein
VDVIAAFTPWIAPLVPAAIGYANVIKYLDFPIWLAWVYAAVVEFLGLATVTTALQFWSWNQDENGEQAPFNLALSTALFYLTITIAVNVLLDQGDALVKLVKALASTFSIVGALTLALRSQQGKRLEKLAQAQAETFRLTRKEEERCQKEEQKVMEQARKEEERKQKDQQNILELARLEQQKEIERLHIEAEERRKDKELSRKLRHEEKLAEIAAKVSERSQKVSGKFSDGLESSESYQKLTGKSSDDGESYQKVSEEQNNFPETFGKFPDWRQLPAEHRKRVGGMSNLQVRAEYGISEKTAGNWIRSSKELVEV